MMLDVRQKFQDNQFPVDVFWNDLDYMVDYQDFTLQPNFIPAEMNTLTNITDQQGVYWVPLIDMGVAVGTAAAVKGLSQGIFLNSSVYPGQTMVGCVWPGAVYYPDFNQ